MLDRDFIDAVFIASATNTHAEHLRRAPDADIAVLCEKPIDLDLDLDRAVDVVGYTTARSTRVTVNFNRRFDRNHELKRVMDSGKIGQVELIQLTFRGPAVPPLSYHRGLRWPDARPSGALLRPRPLDRDVDPVEVFAAGSTLAEPRLAEYGDVDTSVLILRLPSGALVQIDDVRRTGYGYDERIEVLGSSGMVESRRHRTGAVSRYSAGRVVHDGLHPGRFERVRPTYSAALAQFVAALENGDTIAPSLDDGLKAQAIAESATRSLTTGRSEPIVYPT